MRKLLILIVALLLSSCSNDDCVTVETKHVTLNTKIVLAEVSYPMFGRKAMASCEFPELYNHKIPSEFNVYFIGDTETYEFTGVKEGKNTFEIPAIKYRIVVTNSDKKFRDELPIYSEILYLFGEDRLDFSKVDTADIIITNDYASVMVVNNSAIKSSPQLDGQNMMLAGEYYNLYTRKEDSTYLNLGSGVNQKFKANEVYRFMICPEGSFNLVIDTDILKKVNDKIVLK